MFPLGTLCMRTAKAKYGASLAITFSVTFHLTVCCHGVYLKRYFIN